MATISRKKAQSFGLSAIEPFIKNDDFTGYGDVSGLYVKNSGYCFLYGITYLAKSDVLIPPGTSESVPESQTVHISFGDRFNESIVLYCLIPENEPSLHDVLLVVLDDSSFQRFAFPANSTIPEVPASSGAWGVVGLVEFMTCNADMNQESALAAAEFKRVGMLILEHLKTFKPESDLIHHVEYDHIFYPRGRKRISELELEDNAELINTSEVDAAEDTAELVSQPKLSKNAGANTKKEIARLLAEAAAAYAAAPTPRKRGASVRFDQFEQRVDSDLNSDPKTSHSSVNIDRPIIVDMKSMTPIDTTGSKSNAAGKKPKVTVAKTPEHKEAEAQVKDYRKQLQEVEKSAKQIETELKALKAKVAADTAAAARAATQAVTAAAASAKKGNSAAAAAAAPNTAIETESRDFLRSHADADLVHEKKRDEHLFTLLERANTLV